MTYPVYWECDWCHAETRTGSANDFGVARACSEPRNTNGGLCQWAVIRPESNREYQALVDSARKPSWCMTCKRGGFQPSHWPSMNCGGGSRPGRPVRAHCTCDACF